MAMTAIENRPHRTTRANDGMATSWPESVRRAMVNRDVLATGIEMLKADLGLRIVPVNEDKSPVASLCPTWSTDATDDPQTLRQWHAVWPDIRWGIVPGDQLVVIDHDAGELDIRALGIEGTWAEQTRRGTHYWCRIAPGLAHSGKTYLSNKRGEITTGSAGYVVASPADPYVPIDVHAPFVTITDTSPVLDLLRPQRTVVPIEISTMTEHHRREARQVVTLLRQAPDPIGRDMRSLLANHLPPDASASEADFRLALCASWWTLDPAVILAVLVESALPREKWRRADYLPRTIGRVLARRAELSQQGAKSTHLLHIAEHIATGHALRGLPMPTTVSYRTLPTQAVDREALIGNILSFAESVGSGMSGGRWRFADGWVQIPVNDFASVHQVNPKTVQRAIKAAKKGGLIEWDTPREKLGGRFVCHSLVRLIRADAVLLSLPVPLVALEHEEAA